jgi:HK97 gp10 family phage protein
VKEATCELIGLKELETKLENLLEIGGKPSRALDSAGRKAWSVPLDDARRLVPKDTWALHDSIAITVKRPGGKYFSGDNVHVSGLMIRYIKRETRRSRYQSGVTGPVPNPRKYWWLVEFGTEHSGAKSFIRAAVDPNAQSIAEGFRTALDASVTKAIKEQNRINGEDFE